MRPGPFWIPDGEARLGDRGWGLALVAVLLIVVVMAPSSAAHAQQTVEAEASAFPVVIPPTGATVRYWIEVVVPDAELPVTITSVSSDLYGDVADSANPALVSTSCAVPADYTEAEPGWVGWWCEFEVWVEGEPGEKASTISATVVFGDGTEVVASDAEVVTISDQLGGIHGTVLDSGTGLPISGVFVWSGCDGCGTFTDAAGGFAFNGLEPGDYWLKSGNADPGGMDTVPPEPYSTVYAFEYYEEEPLGPPDPLSATLVSVLPGEITRVVWELTVGGAIEGTVTDEGEPIAGVEVVHWMQLGDGSLRGYGRGGYVTDADGTYRIVGLRAGDHLVCFRIGGRNECWDHRRIATSIPENSEADVIGVVLGETIAGIDASFPLTQQIAPSGEQPIAVLPFTGSRAGPLAVAATALLAAGTAVLFTGKRRKIAAKADPSDVCPACSDTC